MSVSSASRESSSLSSHCMTRSRSSSLVIGRMWGSWGRGAEGTQVSIVLRGRAATHAGPRPAHQLPPIPRVGLPPNDSHRATVYPWLRLRVRRLKHVGDRSTDQHLAAHDAHAFNLEFGQLLGDPLGGEIVGRLRLLALT